MRALRFLPLILTCLAALACLPAAAADDEAQAAPQRMLVIPELADEALSWTEGDTATGNWFGARRWLLERGIVPTIAYVTDILGNPVGGKVGKVRYAHDIFVGLNVDLQQLAGLPGSQVLVSMSSRTGNNLSADIGNIFTVAQTCCEPQTRLVTLAWQQAFLDDRLDIRIGHLSIGDDFLTSSLYGFYVSGGINSNAYSLGLNAPFSEYPDSSAGLRVRGQPWEPLTLRFGVYDGNPAFNGKHGVDFDFSFDDGAMILGELEFRLQRGDGATALPGHLVLGGYYDTGPFERLVSNGPGAPAGETVHGNGGVYASVDQQILRFGDPAEGRGLIPFMALTGAPAADINPVPFFINGGFVAQGPWAKRPDDALLFGFVYGDFTAVPSDDDPDGPLKTYEAVLEWSYVIQVTPWLQFQPDLQYVIRPGATGAIPNSLVLGAQIAVTL